MICTGFVQAMQRFSLDLAVPADTMEFQILYVLDDKEGGLLPASSQIFTHLALDKSK